MDKSLKTALTILLVFSGVGIIGIIFYIIVSMVQTKNIQAQALANSKGGFDPLSLAPEVLAAFL